MIYVRQAQDKVEEYGLDDSDEDNRFEAYSAWYDKQQRKLVLESDRGEAQRFELTGYVINEVDAFLKNKAREKYGSRTTAILNSLKKRKEREN